MRVSRLVRLAQYCHLPLVALMRLISSIGERMNLFFFICCMLTVSVGKCEEHGFQRKR
jgi:hypothetical protein